MTRVLIVEDEDEIADLISLHLRRVGFDVTALSSVEAAIQKGKSEPYDLYIVDWMLPGISGVDFVDQLATIDRKKSVLMVTAKSQPEDIIRGLDAGADDYITKPFEPSILVARTKALLRRTRDHSTSDFLEWDHGGLKVSQSRVFVQCGEEVKTLTPSEFRLLCALLKNAGRVLTRESLIQYVQGDGVNVVGRTVDTHIFGIRKKLGRYSELIETIRSVGYRIRFPNG